ncbi:reverse transcriptase domain-containing protein [Tanacetum coccineum]
MQTRSSSKFVGEPSTNPPSTSTNPRRHNRRRSNQRVEPFALEEIPVVTMADQRTMAERPRAPTEGYAETIITSTLKYKDVPETSIKLMLFPFSIDGPARIWLDKEPPRSILTWDDLMSKFISHFFPPSKTTNLRNEISNFEQRFEETFYEAWDRFKDLLPACPHHGFNELHQLDTFYNGLNPSDQDSLNSAAGGNLLERSTQDVLRIIENKSKVRNSRNKPIVSQVKESNVDSSEIASVVASAVTSAMTAMFKQHQVTPTPASIKAVEESCVTCGGAHSYRECPATDGNTFLGYHDNIQGYVSAAALNYNQGNTGYRPQSVANQIRPPGFAQPNVQNNQTRYNQGYNQDRGNYQGNTSYQVLIQTPQVATSSDLEKIKKMNEVNIKSMQTQINNVKNELRNEMQSSIQASMSNQTNELKNMMASFFQMNTASTSGSGSLPSNTVANPKGELDPRHPHIPYPSRMNQEKKQDKDEVQIHKFWQMFKQLHVNISLADALILIPKYQKMLKSLLSNKEKLLELANTPLNENCSAVILKKLPEKLGDPGKFLIPCGFSELKCKALADLGASINLMPLSVWKKLGLPKLISTRMTLELANREICTPVGIARDVFVPVGRFTFPADFVIIDYESDPRAPLILGRPFLRTARALIDVHGEEMILHDGDERLILNTRHDTSTFQTISSRIESPLIVVYYVSLGKVLKNYSLTYHDYPCEWKILLRILEPVTKSSSSSPTLTSIEESDLIWEEFEAYLVSDSFLPGNSNPLSHLPPFHNSLSGSTTSSSPSLLIFEPSDYSLEEFADELAHFTFPPGIDYLPFDAESDLREIEYLLNHNPIKEMDSILEDSVDSFDDNLVDTISEMFTDEHALDYSSPPLLDDYNDV